MGFILGHFIPWINYSLYTAHSQLISGEGMSTQILVTKRKKINDQSSENRKSVGHSYSIFHALLLNLVNNRLLMLLKVCFI